MKRFNYEPSNEATAPPKPRPPAGHERSAPVKRTVHGLILAGFVAFTTACTGMHTGSVCIANEDYFIGQRTLAWAPNSAQVGDDPLQAIAPTTLAQIRSETERQLELMGYAFAADTANADMTLSFVVATRQEIVSGSFVETDPFWWGVYGDPGTLTYTGPFKEAFLAIDLADSATGRPLWRGWAEQAVTPDDRSNPGPLIQQAIASILAELPPAARPNALQP